ncbi:hypothetical protein HYE53_05590 [Aggregatibacter actinomycetemcomitans]|uniref:hypothetical protein n=1 Tax=Aggregatibacter actinomycetemcomitans TaxID=714 RepID=UPI00197BDF3A|nr:hypothetical protein [Aggregatibacter actinomycetemcomitans]MBN6070565.1 hypothetical protein [Aggregatibacter actinomycetemcomitans]
MAISFRLEQEIFLKNLSNSFISIRDLFLKLTKERFIQSKYELGIFLLNRFNQLNNEEQADCAYWYKKSPYIDYKLNPVNKDELKIEFKYLAKEGKYNRKTACGKIMLRKEYFKTNFLQTAEKDNPIETLRARITELESQLQKRSVVDSELISQATKYNPTERETHLLIIGALANLLANPNKNASRYVKGTGTINLSAISKDISDQIILLLQPETKVRSEETIKPRLREAINTISKAES